MYLYEPLIRLCNTIIGVKYCFHIDLSWCPAEPNASVAIDQLTNFLLLLGSKRLISRNPDYHIQSILTVQTNYAQHNAKSCE